MTESTSTQHAFNKSHSVIPALLTDKVAIVTGASRGLGAQIAQQMAAAGADASSLTTEEVFDYIATTTPLRQATSVADFANSVLLMASDLSMAITGQSIAVDGGLTMP
ncbi:SDR family oxidoreductase [Psychrobacter sp. APC 3279]|uniref:SDR family oxidoreductase n=1 Tax=Psychrobacter sp. APC 3279 TaxID=3035189 RepID=UPI0025B28705|nr:SDR family oxidoreductase [Psychrobacter sp. APC 3279]MDN3440902.1 SDR family oxidoreductase [Psychrobacter sp. APC 3279]